MAKNVVDTRVAHAVADAKAAVQDFQVQRLKRDFRMLGASENYGQLCDFFATEIYCSKDFTERNTAFRRVTNQFRSIIGSEIYEGLIRLLDLYALSDRLDEEMAAHLAAAGTPTTFTAAQYELAYRALDNYDDRLLQITMISDSFRFTHHVSQMTFIGVLLKSARFAVGLFKKDHALDLLDRAYGTMRDVKDIQPFVAEIERWEIARLDRIYGRKPARAR